MSDLARPSVSTARIAITLSAIACIAASAAHANIVISTTRAIVPVPPGHTSIRLSNTSPSPSLVQIWADSGDGDSMPDTSDAPFEMTPTLFVLGAHESQVVRIDYEGAVAPSSRDPAAASTSDAADHAPPPRARTLGEAHETLYWLNVLDVPSDVQADEEAPGQSPTANEAEGVDTVAEDRHDAILDATVANDAQSRSPMEGHGDGNGNDYGNANDNDGASDNDGTKDPTSADPNALRFVIRTRIKLIVRPRGLTGSALDAPSQLEWHRDKQGTRLTGVNASAYYVTCAPLFVIAANRLERALGTHTFAPRTSLDIALDPDIGKRDAKHLVDQLADSPWTEIVCHAINDYGSIDVFRAPLNAALPTPP